MARRSVFLGKAAVVLAVFLLTAPALLAGDRVRSSKQHANPAPAVVVAVARRRAPVTIQVAVTAPAEPATGTAVLKLRGPDGQVRRFAVEGGPEGLASRVVVLRPGDSLTLHLAAQK